MTDRIAEPSNRDIAIEIAVFSYRHSKIYERVLAALDKKDSENANLKEEVERHEATLRLIAIPELQDKYTPQQLAKHTLRMEPLQP